MSEQNPERTFIEQWKKTFKDHPFKSVFGVWGIIVTGAIAYQWGKNIPTQLKIIHSRIIAQGAMLSGCFLAAIVHFAVDEPKRAVTKKEEFMNQGIRLRNYDVKAPPMSPTASEMK